MGLFRPYEQGKTETDEQTGGRRRGGATRADLVAPAEVEVVAAPEQPEPAATRVEPTAPRAPRQPQKKGTRTPTRAEAEAARMARLHPTLSPKEQKRARREAERTERLRSMDAVESAPERALLRDHVDARFTPPEMTMPIMLIMIVCMFAFSRNFTVQAWLSYAMMVIVLVFLASFIFTWRRFRRVAEERGVDFRRRGLKMYMVNRMMALRAMRRPAPRISRGESY